MRLLTIPALVLSSWLAANMPAAATEMAPPVYSDRTLTLGIEIDRDRAALLRFTVKPRPFVRLPGIAEARPYVEGREVQAEVVLLGPGGLRYTQRVDAGMVCLSHPAGAEPHIEGDTIRHHRDSFLIEVPERIGFDRIEIAYHDASRGGPTRRLLATEVLSRERFTSAGSPFSFGDLAIATNTVGGPVEEDTLATSGDVFWPEDFSDPDIYRIYGEPAETSTRMNVVIVPDGYTYAQKALMESHADGMVNHFRAKTPFKEHDPFINYILVYAYSTESGTDECDCSVIKDTAMGSRFPDAGGSCGSSQNRCLSYGGGSSSCDTSSTGNIVAAEMRAPAHDETALMVNTTRYGGCGGSRATFAAGNSSATELAVHELGHSWAGLADEYTSYNSCGTGAGNINTSTDGVNGAWPEWIGDLGSPREGAQYYTQCVYRPESNCEMRALNQPFCAVCNQRWALVSFGHFRVNPTAPVESASPHSPLVATTGVPETFSVATRLATGAGVTNSFTWTVQGPSDPVPVRVATGVTSYQHTFTEEGPHTVEIEVIADTNFIKPSKYGANVDVATWNVDAVLPIPGEVSGPGAVQPLVFTNTDDLIWEDAPISGATVFNLYRGDVTGLPSGDYGTCLEQDISGSAARDTDTPGAGVCRTYLVSGETSGGEGPLGTSSDSDPRLASGPCP